MIKNKSVSIVIISFFLGSFAFATLDEYKQNFARLYHETKGLNLQEPDQLREAELNLQAMYLLRAPILAGDALVRSQVSAAIRHTADRIQQAGGNVAPAGQQAHLNAAALAQLSDGTHRPSWGTRANSVASAGTAISVFTTRNRVTRAEALMPTALTDEELWHQAVLDVSNFKEGRERRAFLVVLTFLAGELPARQQVVQGYGHSRANHEFLIQWAQTIIQKFTQQSRGKRRKQVDRAEFANDYRILALRLESLNRYFMSNQETHSLGERLRVMASSMQTDVVITEAIETAMRRGPVGGGQRRRGREDEALNVGPEVPAQDAPTGVVSSALGWVGSFLSWGRGAAAEAARAEAPALSEAIQGGDWDYVSTIYSPADIVAYYNDNNLTMDNDLKKKLGVKGRKGAYFIEQSADIVRRGNDRDPPPGGMGSSGIGAV